MEKLTALMLSLMARGLDSSPGTCHLLLRLFVHRAVPALTRMRRGLACAAAAACDIAEGRRRERGGRGGSGWRSCTASAVSRQRTKRIVHEQTIKPVHQLASRGAQRFVSLRRYEVIK